jgi:imidazolonepropionase-like amidohydrolase
MAFRPGLIAPTLLLFGLASLVAVAAPQSTLPSEGIAERPVRHLALTNARIVPEPGRVIERGVIVLRDGRIESVRAGDAVPAGAAVRDLRGKTVFPAFIDVTADLGVPAGMRRGGIVAAEPGSAAHDQQADAPGPRHWNRRVRPELSVAAALEYDPAEAKRLRELGFAVVLAAPAAGVFSGQGALLLLRDSGRANELVLRADLVQHIGFDFAPGAEYPGSLMGTIALIRQTLHDARWQAASDPRATAARIEGNLALDALAAAAGGRQRVLFRLDDELDLDRAAGLVGEFGLDAVLLGSGYEYRLLPQARRAGLPLVLPLRFPALPEVERADLAATLSLAQLQHWEQAPANPARIAAAGLPFALTARGLDDAEAFWPALHRAIEAGLSDADALRALTSAPAAMLGVEDRLGRIAPGRLANLLVADADLFGNPDAKRYEVWVEGERFELAPLAPPEWVGRWQLQWADGLGPSDWTVAGVGDTLEVTIGERVIPARRDSELLRLLPPAQLFGGDQGHARIELRAERGQVRGFRALADGRRIGVVASIEPPAEAAEPAAEPTPPAEPIPLRTGYPAGEYASDGLPPQPRLLLIRGATLWTNDAAGRLEQADLLVRDGRIVEVGQGLARPAGAELIEAAGRHLTPGIIDAHSHTAIARGVNEASHAVTAEVRVADVLDPTDINIYRQLAGGVTVANLLHGSANPVGGQNAVIKLRWGSDAVGLLFDGAPPGVKFALGENVKQSNWGEAFTRRYPQTRMGVEQILREHFNAARSYAEARARRDGSAPRRDLRLDALAEIIAGKRLVHIHSYRQDEILMFVRLAQEYGLAVGSFQHVLEGYKVADEIRDLGAGASAFSDWWAFKMEVLDAIPHNVALMTRVGVVSSLNSDSNELARRLNTEAAKAIRYGGLDEIEALKLITLNPARQLGIDHRVGRLAPGMDADFVLWSGHPLSTLSRVEQTWIDGRRYFDRDRDRALQQTLLAERERLLGKAGAARGKALKLDDKSAEADDGDADADEVARIRQHRHWLHDHAAGRGLYHDGADLVGCSVEGH